MSNNRRRARSRVSSEKGSLLEIDRRRFLAVMGASLGGAFALGAGVSAFPRTAADMTSRQHAGMPRYGMKHRPHG